MFAGDAMERQNARACMLAFDATPCRWDTDVNWSQKRLECDHFLAEAAKAAPKPTELLDTTRRWLGNWEPGFNTLHEVMPVLIILGFSVGFDTSHTCLNDALSN